MGTASRAGFLSVVLPCYKAAPLARRSVARLHEVLDARGEEWEVIVVDAGGGDFARGEWAADPRVRLITFPANRGKGAAVRAGMLAARGDVRVFTDVDLPFGVALFDVIAGYIRNRGFHVVIGDRTLPGSRLRRDLLVTLPGLHSLLDVRRRPDGRGLLRQAARAEGALRRRGGRVVPALAYAPLPPRYGTRVFGAQ